MHKILQLKPIKQALCKNKNSIKFSRTNRIGKIHNLAHHKSLGCLSLPYTHISFIYEMHKKNLQQYIPPAIEDERDEKVS